MKFARFLKLRHRWLQTLELPQHQITAHIKQLRRQGAAFRLLSAQSRQVQDGPFSIKQAPAHIARRQPATRHIRQYPRLSMAERKRVENLLKLAHPELNRKERRHLRDQHRWMFIAHS